MRESIRSWILRKEIPTTIRSLETRPTSSQKLMGYIVDLVVQNRLEIWKNKGEKEFLKPKYRKKQVKTFPPKENKDE
jgi:hypothetical protein